MTEHEMNTQVQTDEKVWVTLRNLQRYKENSDEFLKEKLEANATKVFKGQKTSLETADSEVIKKYFEEHTKPQPKEGDVFIVETLVEGKLYEMSSYCYLENKWEAITGNVDANKVILRNDFIGAGNWSQIGNYTKAQNGTSTIQAKGLSVTAFLQGMVSKREQPRITAQPAVSGFALNGAKAVEVGTKVPEAKFGNAALSAGAYEYGPATGVVAKVFKVDRIALPSSYNQESVASAASGVDNNEGKGFIIGDGAEENTVTSLKYKVTVTHNEGVQALDNLKALSKPEIKIASGTKVQETAAYTGFRQFFYGATSEKPEVNSAYVRGLTNSNCAYSPRTLSITVPAGTKRVAIACISGKTGVTRVINETALNADVTSTFVKSTVAVEGANGYTAKDYNIWVFEPAEAYKQIAVLKVTLG